MASVLEDGSLTLHNPDGSTTITPTGKIEQVSSPEQLLDTYVKQLGASETLETRFFEANSIQDPVIRSQKLLELQDDLKLYQAFEGQVGANPALAKKFELLFNTAPADRALLSQSILEDVAPVFSKLDPQDALALMQKSLEVRYGHTNLTVDNVAKLFNNDQDMLENLAEFRLKSKELFELDKKLTYPDVEQSRLWLGKDMVEPEDMARAQKIYATLPTSNTQADWSQFFNKIESGELELPKQGLLADDFEQSFIEPLRKAWSEGRLEDLEYMQKAFVQGGLIPEHAMGARQFAQAFDLHLGFRQTPMAASIWNMNGMAGKPGHYGFPDQLWETTAKNVFDADGIPLANRLPDGMNVQDWAKTMAGEFDNAPYWVKSFRGGYAEGVVYNPWMPQLGLPASVRSDYDALTYAFEEMDEAGNPFLRAMNNEQADALGSFIDAAMTGQLDFDRFTQKEFDELMRLVSEGNEDGIDQLASKILGPDYTTSQIKHPTHTTLPNFEQVVGYPGPSFIVEPDSFQFLKDDTEVGQWVTNLEGGIWPNSGKKDYDLEKLAQDLEAYQNERRQILGNDPKRGYVAHEGEVGALIERDYGGFERDPSGMGEWTSTSGKYKGDTFDLLGIPSGIDKFHSDDMEKFLPSIDSHFQKSIDHIILDTRYMRPAQKETVLRYIEKEWSSEKHRLILLE